jgi:hypothetical protein
MDEVAKKLNLIPAQEWRQAQVDIGTVFLVKRPRVGGVKLAFAGTVDLLAGSGAEDWGKGLLQDRLAARKWFLGNEEIHKQYTTPYSTISSWVWPPPDGERLPCTHAQQLPQ